MTNTPAPTQPTVEPRTRRLALAARACMKFLVRIFLLLLIVPAVVLLALFAFAGIDLDSSFTEWRSLLSQVVSALFLLAVFVRITCCASYGFGGSDIRAKDEATLDPPHLRGTRTQRIITASRLALFDLAVGIIAATFLAENNSPPPPIPPAIGAAGWAAPLVQPQPPPICVAARAVLCILCIVFILVVLVRIIAIIVQAVTVSTPDVEDQKSNKRKVAGPLWLLTLFRRLTMHVCLPLFPFLLLLSALDCLDLLHVPRAWAWAMAITASLVALLVFARFVAVALLFARFSMLHIMGFNLALSLLITLTVTMPSPWRVIPFLAALILVMWALIFIVAQDPEGDRLTPDFVRQRLREQRKQRRAKAVIALSDAPGTTSNT